MNKKLIRRDFLRAASLAAGGVVIAACQPQTIEKTVVVKETQIVESTRIVEQQVEVTKVVEEQVGNTVVNVTINGNLLSEASAISEAMLFTVYLMDYNLKNKGSGVTAMYEAWPGGDDYNTKVRLMTASGELGNTVLWGNWASLPNYVDDSTLLPLDDLMESASVKLDEWVPSAQELMKYNPKDKKPGEGPVWGLPIMGNPGAAFLFYNKTVLDKAGVAVPTDTSTLSEVTDIAKGVKENLGVFGIQENLWGTTHGLGWDHGYVSPFGGLVLDETGKTCLINSEEALKAYNWQYNLRHVDKIEGTPDDITAYGNYTEGCEKGAVAMYKMGAWGASWFLLRPSNENPEMGFSLFPASWDGNLNGRRGNTLGINWYGIAAGAPNPVECFDVLYWFNTKEAGLYAIESGQTTPAPRGDVLSDPLLNDYPIVKSTGLAITTSEKDPVPANLRNTEVNEALTQAMSLVDTGSQMPDQIFLDKLASDMQAALDLPPV